MTPHAHAWSPHDSRILAALIGLFAVLGVLYSLTTPIFEASDELWHYPMADHLASSGFVLPVQQPGVMTPWRQEGSQPPLYYFMAAALIAPFERSDLAYFRRVNPHADIGVIRADGNHNMIVHRPGAEGWPYTGTVLAVHVARIFSIVLAAGTVACTYGLARRLFPAWREIAIAAALFNAALPMFLFISGSVNNDNLSNLLGSAITLTVVILLQRTHAPGVRDYIVLGVLCGAGLLAKLNIGFLLPVVAFTLFVLAVRFRRPAVFFVGGFVSGGLTIAIAGWWYLRNVQLYGDPTGLGPFLDIVGRRQPQANLAQLWAERDSFLQAFWGFFGGVNVPMPAPVYAVLNAVGAIALISAVVFCAWHIARWVRRGRPQPAAAALPWAVTWLWMLITFLSYLQWTSITPASQGRLIFGAIASICVWFAVGLFWPFAGRPVAGRVVLGTSAGALAVLAVLVPFVVIRPAYAAPVFIAPVQTAQVGGVSAVFTHTDENGTVSTIALQHESFRISTPQVRPGEDVVFTVNWQIEQQGTRDWSLFVHLVTPDGVIIGQRDVYPAGGRLATSDLTAGTAWANPIAVHVPGAAYAPMPLSIALGWYHLHTGERMRLPDGSAALTLGTVALEPRAGTFPNPIAIDFDRQIRLVGYTLSDLSPQAGDTVTLTLFWQAQRAIARDYVVFAHILDPATLTRWAASNAMPAGWARPTTTWTPGETIEDPHMLTLAADTPPGIYELEIGLYEAQDGRFDRLRIVTPDGGMANDYTYLSRVRVFPPEGAGAGGAAAGRAP
jgi:4-amino-4-deoxy-L-arabinose transferase-like glycosyltransferase